ncbi:MAG: hypothetical protein OHK0029_19630 [Armatimonadaceae bacterium]
MKLPFSVIAVVVACLLSVPVYAQNNPAEPPPPAKTQPAVPIDRSTPVKTLTSFVRAFLGGELQGAVRCVAGAVYSAPVRELEKDIREDPPPPELRLAVTEIKTETNGKTATLTYRLQISDEIPAKELRTTFSRDAGGWQIIAPPAPDREMYEKVRKELDEDSANAAMTAMIVSIRYPETIRQNKEYTSFENFQEIAKACIMRMQDYDEVFQITPSSLKRDLNSYVKDDSSFSSRLDPRGTESYRFNPKLAGKSLSQIADPSRLIMLYEGEWKKPLFRYEGGKALIAFADGTCKLMTPAELKNALWEIPVQNK